MATEPEEKTMYHVEKFLPPECPKCRHTFTSEGVDYTLLFGDIVNGEKKIRATTGYNIIICSHCRNFTARFPLESWQVSSKQRAEELVQQGFTNLLQVTAFGSHTQDHHFVHSKLPGIRVEAISIDQPNRLEGK